MSEHKVLAVMGSPACGKTTASIKLALELAKHRKNTIVVFCDPFTPVIPFAMPTNAMIDISLGTLLTAPGLTQKNILEASLPVAQTEYISLLGYKAGDSLMAYPKITKDKTLDFFIMLRHLVDYVIIDCSAVFEADPVSIVGVEAADTALRLGTANLKGISYYHTHMPMLAGSGFRAHAHFKSISMLKPWQEWSAVSQQFGGADFMLPFVPELERQFDELSLFEPLTSNESQSYTAEIQNIIKSIFGLQDKSVKAVRPIKTKDRNIISGKLRIKLPFGKSKGEF